MSSGSQVVMHADGACVEQAVHVGKPRRCLIGADRHNCGVWEMSFQFGCTFGYPRGIRV